MQAKDSKSGNLQNKGLGAHLHCSLHKQLLLEVSPLINSKPSYFFNCKAGRVGLKEIQAEEK